MVGGGWPLRAAGSSLGRVLARMRPAITHPRHPPTHPLSGWHHVAARAHRQCVGGSGAASGEDAGAHLARHQVRGAWGEGGALGGKERARPTHTRNRPAPHAQPPLLTPHTRAQSPLLVLSISGTWRSGACTCTCSGRCGASRPRTRTTHARRWAASVCVHPCLHARPHTLTLAHTNTRPPPPPPPPAHP